jgi:hypothetical protein
MLMQVLIDVKDDYTTAKVTSIFFARIRSSRYRDALIFAITEAPARSRIEPNTGTSKTARRTVCAASARRSDRALAGFEVNQPARISASIAFRSAFAAPAEFGGDFAWHWCRVAAGEFVAHELKHPTLDCSQFIEANDHSSTHARKPS